MLSRLRSKGVRNWFWIQIQIQIQILKVKCIKAGRKNRRETGKIGTRHNVFLFFFFFRLPHQEIYINIYRERAACVSVVNCDFIWFDFGDQTPYPWTNTGLIVRVRRPQSHKARKPESHQSRNMDTCPFRPRLGVFNQDQQSRQSKDPGSLIRAEMLAPTLSFWPSPPPSGAIMIIEWAGVCGGHGENSDWQTG